MISIRVDKASKLNGERTLFVSFPYNSEIIDYIRSFPSKWWHANEKEWELPLDKLGKLTEKFPGQEFEITGMYLDMTPKQVEIPTGFEFKTKPFQHQIEAFEYGLQYDRWLLGDEMGLGKTKQAIDIAVAKKLQKGYKHCLIICGVNGLKWNWMNEITVHSNETGYILGQRKNKIGSNADKLQDVKDLDMNDNYFIITNVESLRSEDIVSALAKQCDDGIIGMIVMDEAHKCFDYETLICTSKGPLKIGDIVTQNIDTEVLSYNETTDRYEWKPVLNRFENTVNQKLLKLTFKTTDGRIRQIKCTDTHLFYTSNRGWVIAKELTKDDDIVDMYS